MGILVVAILLRNYRGLVDSNQVISFRVDDYPGNLQAGCEPESFGVHYFGDFWSVVCHSRLESPYLAEVGSNYLPLTYWFASLWDRLAISLGFLTAITLAVAVMVGALLFATHKILLSNNGKDALTLTWKCAPFYCLSVGTISTFDRGNIQWIVTALIAIAIAALHKKLLSITVLGLSVAAAMKGYPAALFVAVFFNLSRWTSRIRTAILASTVTIFLIAIPLASFGGGVKTNLNALRGWLSAFADAERSTVAYNHSLVGFTRVIANTLNSELLHQLADIQGSLLTVAVLLSAYCVYALRNPLHPNAHWTFGMFAMTSLVPLTGGYVMAIWLLQFPMSFSLSNQRLRYGVLIALAILSLPRGFQLFTTSLFLTPLLSGPLTLLILFFWMADSSNVATFSRMKDGPRLPPV